MDKTEINELVLQHWGIKGQKWGHRRYQNKDGSLTPEGRKRYGDGDETSDGDNKPRKLSKKQRKAEAKAREEAETIEEKRARLLKSSDARELYKNRDLLTNEEINDRLYRIGIERKLEQAMNDALPPKEKLSDKFADKVSSVLKVGNSINDVYSFATEKPIMKAFWKKIGLSKDENKTEIDPEKLYKNRLKGTPKEIQERSNILESLAKMETNMAKIRSSSNNSDSNSKPKDSDNNSKPKDSDNNSKPKDSSSNANSNDTATGATGVKGKKWIVNRDKKLTSKVANESISNAKKEIGDALSKVPKNTDLQKEAAKEIIREVGPEIGEIIRTFNQGMIEANQRRLNPPL